MSITITVDVFCDFCLEWTQGCTTCNATDARKNAKRRGWKYKKTGGKMQDICPDCQRKWNKKKGVI